MKMEFRKIISYVMALGVLTSNINIDVSASNSDEYGFTQGNSHPNGVQGSVDYTDERPYFTRDLYDQYLGYGVNQSANALVVTATASHDVSYQWLADGVPIEGATSYMYYPTTADQDKITYNCVATNVVTGHSTTSNSTTVIVSYEYGYNVETPMITEQYSSTITYERYSSVSPLVISVDPRINGSLTYTWYCTDTQNNTTNVVSTGYADQMSKISLSVNPSTSNLGTYLYYCDVVNEYNDRKTSARSEMATIIVTDKYNPRVDYTAIGTDGTLILNQYADISLDYTALNNFVSRGGENVYIQGEYIQCLHVPATSYSNSYTVNIHDIGTGLNYAWKIRYGNTVASNLDLSLNTASSLNNVDQGSTNLDFTPNMSQVIKFNHSGMLNSDGSTMTLFMPTSVSDGTVYLYKLYANQIMFNEEVIGSVTNGLLTVNMTSCSDWVISKNRLMNVTSSSNASYTSTSTSVSATTTSTSSAVSSIPTDARVSIPQFQNVVVGTVLNLSNINLSNTLTSYRFEGWYYDTGYTLPVTGTDLTSLYITGNILSNGLYPKFTYYNTSTPDVSYPVPSTQNMTLARLF